MYISKLRLMNWRNFKAVNVPLGERMFFVVPNASGKSNLLYVFRFLKDITRPDGGFAKSRNDAGRFSENSQPVCPQKPPG